MILLNTERLLIRKFTPDDWFDLHEYLSQAAVVRFEPYEIYTEDASKREAITRSESDSFWAVCLKDGGKLIGNIYLAKQEFDTWELGYVFNERYQGNGFATEAAFAMVDFVFKQKNAYRVIAMCNPLNHHSWKLLERLGFRREGHLRRNIWFKKDSVGNPIWADTYEYGVLASEWQIRRSNNNDFWVVLDKLVSESEIVIDRPKGSAHPRYPDFIYPLDYGYLKGTTAMDGGGVDVWRGSDPAGNLDAIMCIVDLVKRDSEIKLLIGCTEEEKAQVYQVHNETEFMKGVIIRRDVA